MKIPTRIYDLSQPLYNDSPDWPAYDPIAITRPFRRATKGHNAEKVTLMTHAGTHVDAPFHFFDNGATIDRMPLETYAGRAVVLDMRHKPAGSVMSAPDFDLLAAHIEPDDIVLLYTGWGHKRAFTEEYLTDWPYLDGHGATWLTAHGVKGVGTDALSLGGWGGPEKGHPCHQVLLGAGKFIVENLRLMDELLDGKKRFFCAFPISITGASGAWARAVAWDLG